MENEYEFVNYVNHKDDYEIKKETRGNASSLKGINPFETLQPIKYYQITMFKNPHTKYRMIRIFDIDENNNFSNIKVQNITSETYRQILKRMQPQKYKVFPTYNFDEVNPPSLYDISLSRSSLLL